MSTYQNLLLYVSLAVVLAGVLVLGLVVGIEIGRARNRGKPIDYKSLPFGDYKIWAMLDSSRVALRAWPAPLFTDYLCDFGDSHQLWVKGVGTIITIGKNERGEIMWRCVDSETRAPVS